MFSQIFLISAHINLYENWEPFQTFYQDSSDNPLLHNVFKHHHFEYPEAQFQYSSNASECESNQFILIVFKISKFPVHF